MDGVAGEQPAPSPPDEWVRWVARVWAELAIVGYLLWQATTPAPTRGEGDYWERLAAIVILVVIIGGHLVSRRWEIQGATVMAVGGSMLGLVTSFRFAGWEPTAAVLLMFTVPALLYWVIWRRGQPLGRRIWLASLLTVLVTATFVLGAAVQFVAYGPSHPQSPLPALPPAPVVWAWSGALTPTSATVVARLRNPTAAARLAVSTGEDLSEPIWIQADPRPHDDPGIARFALTGLEPGTRYHYAVEADGALVTERSGRLRTAPQGAGSFSFAFGNCQRVGSSGSSLDRIREADPLLFVHTGDFAYEDFWTDDRDAVRGMYDTQLTTPAMDALVRAVPFVYVWDDHDFGPNDADSTAASAPASQVVYREVVPHAALPAGDGPEAIYHSFTVGRVRFVIMDTRSERSPKSAPDDANKTMLGSRQWEWLVGELGSAAAAGQAVVLVSSVPWNAAARAGADDWSGYATARRALADAIAAAGLADQMLMIAGDAHMLAVDDGTNTDFSSAHTGGFPLMHAGALDRIGDVKAGPYSEGALPGSGQFGLVSVTDEGTDITFTLSARDHTGAQLIGYEFTVAAPALWRTG